MNEILRKWMHNKLKKLNLNNNELWKSIIHDSTKSEFNYYVSIERIHCMTRLQMNIYPCSWWLSDNCSYVNRDWDSF